MIFKIRRPLNVKFLSSVSKSVIAMSAQTKVLHSREMVSRALKERTLVKYLCSWHWDLEWLGYNIRHKLQKENKKSEVPLIA